MTSTYPTAFAPVAAVPPPTIPDNLQVLFYGRFELSDKQGKTPKYELVAGAGSYAPFEALRGKDGKVSLYLIEIAGGSERAPLVRIQGKNSLNVTGLKGYTYDTTAFAFGYPQTAAVFGYITPRPNPFYPTHVEDGFLFRFHGLSNHGGRLLHPSFEFIVIEKARKVAGLLLDDLKRGGVVNEILQPFISVAG